MIVVISAVQQTGLVHRGQIVSPFILPAHEIENYLLDASALSISRLNNLKSTPQEIDEMMRTAAGRLCWWTACREVVAELRTRFRENFLSDPKFPPVNSQEAVQHHICDSEWFRKLGQEIARSTIEDIHRELVNAHGPRFNRWPMGAGGSNSPARKSFVTSAAAFVTAPSLRTATQVQRISTRTSPRRSHLGKEKMGPFPLTLPISFEH